jgi:hypothetical protein
MMLSLCYGQIGNAPIELHTPPQIVNPNKTTTQPLHKTHKHKNDTVQVKDSLLPKSVRAKRTPGNTIIRPVG